MPPGRLPPRPPDTAPPYCSERLLHSLAAIHTVPLTVIEAPMGYGKTVAAREFLRTQGIPAMWVPVLGPSPDVFWRDFCRGLKRFFLDRAGIVESLLRLGYPYDPVRAGEARELISLLPFFRKKALVIDDCHLLDGERGGPDFVALCELLARSGTPNLRIVLISRPPYAGNRDFLELKGLLHHVGQDVLALTPKEIGAYFAQCGVNLNEEQADLLHAETGGWISALSLYLPRCRREGVISRPAVVSGLLEKEVYAPLSEPLKKLLFALFPLGRFTKEQADALYGGDTRELLDELRRKNSFVLFDPAGGMFTLHDIFRQYLEKRFSRLPQAERRKIFMNCGRLFAGQGENLRAIEAYYAAGAFEEALALLESDMGNTLVTENARLFADLLAACPEEILRRHLPAAFKSALAAFSSADFSAFAARCAWLAGQCAAMPENDPQTAVWRGELEMLRSLAAYNDIAAMSRHHRKAYALLGGPTRLFGAHAPWTLGSLSVLFMFHRENGKLADEIRLMHDCLPFYYRLASHHGAGGEYLMEAEAAYNAGEFSPAEILCHKAVTMAARHGQLACMLCALFLLLRLALVAADFHKARRLAENMRGRVKKSRNHSLLHAVDLCEGYLYAALGQHAKAPAWLKTDIAEAGRLYLFAGGFYYLVHGRLLLLAGEYAGTLGLFECLLEKKTFTDHPLFSIHARICLAAARQALGDRQAALRELRAAMVEALPDGLYMPFAENGDLLGSLLKEAAAGLEKEDGSFARHTARMLDLARTWELARNGMAARHFSAGKGPLTRREMELARLAAGGKQYKEIATILGLSPGTVKRAFVVIRKKLGITRRGQLREYLEARNASNTDKL